MGIAKAVLWFWGVMFFLGIPTILSLTVTNGWWAFVVMGVFVGIIIAVLSLAWACNTLWPYEPYR